MTADPGCVDCGWRPAPGELWPTEGPLAVRWIERFLICAEGDWFGKPIRLRRDQKAFLYRWYEFCPACGYWHYDQALRMAATGDGKTTFVAAIECLEMFGPPSIAPVSPNIVNAAASFEQADKLFGFAGTMLGGRDQAVKEAPLRGYAEVYDTEIKRSDGSPGVMQRVAAVAGTNEGGLPSLFVCDEVHEWGDVGDRKARVHTVIGKSTSKRRLICRIPEDGDEFREITRGPGRILNISTAGFDVDHSLLGAMYKNAVKVARDPSLSPRLLVDIREARPGLDYYRPEDRRTAVQDASAAAGILWDVEKRVREWEKPELEHHEWVRYYANAWVPVPADSWLKEHPMAWRNCQGAWEITGDEPTVLSVDMSLRQDSTAVVELAKLADGRVAVTAKIWAPGQGVVDHGEVFTWIRDRALELGRRFRGVVYDPRFFEVPARMLEGSKIDVIQFDQTAALMVPACKETFAAIVAECVIVHDGDPDLVKHVVAAAKRPGDRGWTLSKGRSKRPIDAAIALVMGYWTLLHAKPPRNWANTVH